MSLADELKAAWPKTRTVTGWGTRGRAWADGQPVAVMQHHTALPVPFPVDRLYGRLLKANMNTKPDGTIWLIAQGACNYSSGSGSSVVLGEVSDGSPPSENASERGLADDMDGNPWFWNFENDHPGDGSPIPDIQLEAIAVGTQVVLVHYGLTPAHMCSHAEWTRRKRDPYWNGSLRAIETVRDNVEAAMTFLPVREGDGFGARTFKRSDVAAIQAMLNRLGAGLTEDGKYEASTVTAVKTLLGGDGKSFYGSLYDDLHWKVAVKAASTDGVTPGVVDAKIDAHALNPDAHHA